MAIFNGSKGKMGKILACVALALIILQGCNAISWAMPEQRGQDIMRCFKMNCVGSFFNLAFLDNEEECIDEKKVYTAFINFKLIDGVVLIW